MTETATKAVKNVRPETWKKLRLYAAMLGTSHAEAIDSALDAVVELEQKK
jgi:hypothetical protein|tara:strand:+ start:1464 stop:1613 length:150 start_codon:yes stop_codon:yes gene_type:complete